MSAYAPPSEFPATFNSSIWSATTNLTTAAGDSRYLKLTGGTVTGVSTFTSNISVGTNLYVDTVNNRVGVNEVPSQTLSVTDPASVTSNTIAHFVTPNL